MEILASQHTIFYMLNYVFQPQMQSVISNQSN